MSPLPRSRTAPAGAAGSQEARRPGPARPEPACGQRQGVDPLRWPRVATVPAIRPTSVLARLRFGRAAAELVPLPVGTPAFRVHRPADLYARLAAGGRAGLTEAYLAGDWDAEDLTGVLQALDRRNLRPGPRRPGSSRPTPARATWARATSAPEPAAPPGLVAHELSADLLALFLDATMSWAGALFDTVPARATWADLAQAQGRAVDRLLDAAGVRAGTRLLEIGTGGPELALRAARRGALVRCLTGSWAQHDLARHRVAAQGLGDRVSVERLAPWQATGRYDAVVSRELVGTAGGWPAFLAAVPAVLAPGGRVAVQVVTMPHERLPGSRSRSPWTHPYLETDLPLASLRTLAETAAGPAGLTLRETFGFGAHYARTLALWQERFVQAGPAVAALGFDATFARLWRLHLAGREAGFRSGRLDVHQLAWTGPGETSGG